MVLLLENAVETVVSDLSPLELGETNLLFIIVAAIIIAGFIILFLITLTRKSSAMSDAISKESHAKFAAITPTSTPPLPNHQQPKERTEIPQPPSPKATRIEDGGSYLTFRRDLLETKLQLERYTREKTGQEEKLRETHVAVEKLGTEVAALRDRQNATGQEYQKLKTTFAEQSFKLQNQRQDIESQRAQVEKLRDRPEVEKLNAEISKLKELLQNNEQEIQKLRTTLEEQNMNLKRVSDLAAQTWGTLDTMRRQPIPPAMQMAATSFPQTPAPTNLAPITCVNCASPLDEQDKFCIRCGQRVIKP